MKKSEVYIYVGRSIWCRFAAASAMTGHVDCLGWPIQEMDGNLGTKIKGCKEVERAVHEIGVKVTERASATDLVETTIFLSSLQLAMARCRNRTYRFGLHTHTETQTHTDRQTHIHARARLRGQYNTLFSTIKAFRS